MRKLLVLVFIGLFLVACGRRAEAPPFAPPSAPPSIDTSEIDQDISVDVSVDADTSDIEADVSEIDNLELG